MRGTCPPPTWGRGQHQCRGQQEGVWESGNCALIQENSKNNNHVPAWCLMLDSCR